MNAPTPLMASLTDKRLASDRRIPIVSVIIANRNNATFLPDCLESVMRQTLVELEVIIVDDASDDHSREVIAKYVALDPRITLLCNQVQGGPGQARNRALDICRGQWISVLDGDDLMHPERLANLVRAAEDGDLDILADNQILFYEASETSAHPLLKGRSARDRFTVSCASYVRSNALCGGGMPLGYLKPIFRRSFIERCGFRYSVSMLVAEDYDFVFRLLLAGASFLVVPSLTYFYRRHAASTSFRLSRAALVRMLEGDTASREAHGRNITSDVERSLCHRRRSIENVLAYTDLVGKLKARDWVSALVQGASSPRAALLLGGLVRDRVRRLVSRGRGPVQAPKRACVLSRQRVTGATNGSSAYLLGICAALREDGWTVDLVSPSPAMFGRWPVLRLLPEMSVFDSIEIRGALRIGSIVIAANPAIALRAFLALADRALARFHLGLGTRARRKAPHAIAVPLTDADRLFVASRARRPSLVIADYEFLTEAVPFTLSPRARSAVVMHDLFSGQKTANRPVIVDRGEEMQMLGAVDLVLAIQKEEADVVAAHLGADRVIVVPMAVDHVAAAQEGDGRTVVFVGSNTLPNIDAVEWLLTEIWPLVSGRQPSARLSIAGAVCQSISTRRDDVQLLGRVDSLTELYRRAAVVVSPLRSGSGLKVKLVEALAHGKAIVGTSVTFQGVEHLAGSAASCADEASAFADAIVSLLASADLRRKRGEHALAAAAREFSPAKSYEELLRFAGASMANSKPSMETIQP